MKKEHMKYLVCPECNNSLDLLKDFRIVDDSIESGNLRCNQCNLVFPIIKFIP